MLSEKSETSKTIINTNHKLIIGDCNVILRNRELVQKESVRLAVTSPPYGLGKDYGGVYLDKFNLESWLRMIGSVSEALYDVLTPDGSFFLNVSPIPDRRTSEIVPLDCYAFLEVKKHGFFLRNKIIWHFNNMQNPTRRLAGRWEAILWFVKDLKNYVFNLDAVRIPYITKGDKRLTGTGRNPTDVWYFDRVNNMTKAKLGIDFPSVFPDPMIERIVRMSSHEGDTILDPFVGSGTTMRVARFTGRNSIGIEINPNYVGLIRRRVEPDKWTLDTKANFEVLYPEAV